MSIGVVTQHLYELIAKQVEDHRLIVWYDPDQVYSAAVAELGVPDATVACYNGSFFQLRHDIDSLMNGEQAPRLVVYIPEDRGNIHHALIELEAAGAIIQPGQQPPNRNTRLAIVARNALKPILGDKTAAEIEKQVETGKLSLADLNALANRGKDISTGVLSLVFGTANPHDVALTFLHSMDLCRLQSQRWSKSLFPRRAVTAGSDYPGGCDDADGSSPGRATAPYRMATHDRDTETDHTLFLRASHGCGHEPLRARATKGPCRHSR
jgi:hypothetical protein